ncbi:hypothetical protein IV61_GL002320 [Levilactobacillus parabrevis]|nr:hypothetical protein IV61_GL002320 [Levilactobacillus parabrevis]
MLDGIIAYEHTVSITERFIIIFMEDSYEKRCWRSNSRTRLCLQLSFSLSLGH